MHEDTMMGRKVLEVKLVPEPACNPTITSACLWWPNSSFLGLCGLQVISTCWLDNIHLTHFFILGLFFPCHDLHAIAWGSGSSDYYFWLSCGTHITDSTGNCPFVFWFGPTHWTRCCLIRGTGEHTEKHFQDETRLYWYVESSSSESSPILNVLWRPDYEPLCIFY